MNKKFIVEIDVDGVLGDMDGSYGSYINHIIPDFSEEKYIKEWGMPDIQQTYPEAIKIIQNLFRDPSFIKDLNRYDGVEDALYNLYNLVNSHQGEILIHTHIFTTECAIEREKWLRKLEKDSNVKFNIDISIGNTKQTKVNSMFLIEDKIDNLKKSNAPYKILMSRGHNRNYGIGSLGQYVEAYKVMNLHQAYLRLQEILENSPEFPTL